MSKGERSKKARREVRWPCLALGIAIVLFVDQATKYAVQTWWRDWLHLNQQAAFNIPVPVWAVGVIAALVSALVIYNWSRWSFDQRGRQTWAVVLLVGGALSNLVDRFWFGGVRDFIDLKIWPVFNLADTAIVVGVAALVWYSSTSSLRNTSHGPRANKSTATRRSA